MLEPIEPGGHAPVLWIGVEQKFVILMLPAPIFALLAQAYILAGLTLVVEFAIALMLRRLAEYDPFAGEIMFATRRYWGMHEIPGLSDTQQPPKPHPPKARS